MSDSPVMVVDASVMASVAFREPRHREAQRLIVDAQLVGSTLLSFELT